MIQKHQLISTEILISMKLIEIAKKEIKKGITFPFYPDRLKKLIAMKEREELRKLYKMREQERNDFLTEFIDSIQKFQKHIKEDLTDTEIIQALNNSISTFIELYDQQPKELKNVLIDYQDTPIKEHITIVKNMFNNSDDMSMINKIFTTYKKDSQSRIYNYDLFAFLYYEYGLLVSFGHLYNSQLLEASGAYKYVKGRPKPVIKKEAIQSLEQHKKAIVFSGYEINIYIENLLIFFNNVNANYYNRYILSFLVDMSDNLKVSKDFLQSLTNKRDKNITYNMLPIPINTLLLTPQQIAN